MEAQNFFMILGGIVLLWFVFCLAITGDFFGALEEFSMLGAFTVFPFIMFLLVLYLYGDYSWSSPYVHKVW